MYPKDLRYSKEHEWVRPEGDEVVIGITHFAQDQLGEIVFVDLPAAGESLCAGAAFGEVESVKSVSELYSPIDGEVVAVNEALTDTPETVNSDPYGEGWMLRVRPGDASLVEGLMTVEDYESFISGA